MSNNKTCVTSATPMQCSHSHFLALFGTITSSPPDGTSSQDRPLTKTDRITQNRTSTIRDAATDTLEPLRTPTRIQPSPRLHRSRHSVGSRPAGTVTRDLAGRGVTSQVSIPLTWLQLDDFDSRRLVGGQPCRLRTEVDGVSNITTRHIHKYTHW